VRLDGRLGAVSRFRDAHGPLRPRIPLCHAREHERVPRMRSFRAWLDVLSAGARSS
jgi:hypothetical protein